MALISQLIVNLFEDFDGRKVLCEIMLIYILDFLRKFVVKEVQEKMFYPLTYKTVKGQIHTSPKFVSYLCMITTVKSCS